MKKPRMNKQQQTTWKQREENEYGITGKKKGIRS